MTNTYVVGGLCTLYCFTLFLLSLGQGFLERASNAGPLPVALYAIGALICGVYSYRNRRESSFIAFTTMALFFGGIAIAILVRSSPGGVT